MATGAVPVEDRPDIAQVTGTLGTHERDGHQAGDERDEAHRSILARTCGARSMKNHSTRTCAPLPASAGSPTTPVESRLRNRFQDEFERTLGHRVTDGRNRELPHLAALFRYFHLPATVGVDSAAASVLSRAGREGTPH